jgi:3-methyl-2-oxobutanoate hydroxymethyltransferase
MTVYGAPDMTKSLVITDLAKMKMRGEKITCLAAYDASFSALLDRVGIDVILVGDSLGMVIQGQASTVPVTMEDMVYHCRCVTRGSKRAFVVADLPFLSYATAENALKNAARLLQQGGAEMVKLEGNRVEFIRLLTDQGVPVCAHLGLLPQSIGQLGGYRVQGRNPDQAEQIFREACAVEQAGATLLVLECVPSALAAKISKALTIPVIGIGAGGSCDGQVLVLYDILNITPGKKPRFSKDFMAGATSIEQAVRMYREAVKSGDYPAAEHSY